jgi:hypothetical protein
MYKKHMTGGQKGVQAVQHAGKGSTAKPLNARNAVSQSGSDNPGAGINNYAKATPMAAPQAPSNPAPSPMPAPGLGSGNWPGIGQ